MNEGTSQQYIYASQNNTYTKLLLMCNKFSFLWGCNIYSWWKNEIIYVIANVYSDLWYSTVILLEDMLSNVKAHVISKMHFFCKMHFFAKCKMHNDYQAN